MGIRAEGGSLEEALTSAAEAVAGLIFEAGEITAGTAKTRIEAKAPTLTLLFVELINDFLSIRDMENLAVSGIGEIKLRACDGGYSVSARVLGEPYRPSRHTVKTEVKAATYAGLSYSVAEGRHVFTCVLDL